jgi:type I restriction enzyme S subunit
LSSQDVRKVRLGAPPETEQHSIAAFLDRETARIDGLVAKKERLIELLQEQRTALITRAVTKGLDPNVPMKDSGVEWLGEIPTHWDSAFLDKLIDPLRGITYGIVQPGEPDPNGIPMVRGQNYSRGWTSLEEIFRVSPDIEAPYRRARLKPGDIVMTIVGAGTGNVAIVPDWLAEANLTQTTARVAVDTRVANSRYIAYQLQSVVGTVSVELTVKGAAQPGLNLGHIAKYRLVVPPISEQEFIVAFLDQLTASLDTLIATVREAIERLKELRTALISAAVTGKIDVRDEVA